MYIYICYVYIYIYIIYIIYIYIYVLFICIYICIIYIYIYVLFICMYICIIYIYILFIYILFIYIYCLYIYMSYICMSSYSVSRPSCLSRVSTWQNPAEWFDACLDKHQDILGISLKVRSTTKNTHGERLKKNIWSWVNACLEPCLENTKPFGTLTLHIYLLQAPPWQRPKCFRQTFCPLLTTYWESITRNTSSTRL